MYLLPRMKRLKKNVEIAHLYTVKSYDKLQVSRYMHTIGAGISIKLLFQNIIFFKIYRLGGVDLMF